MTQQKIKCKFCSRVYSSRAISILHNWVGCKDCLVRLSKGQEPLKYGRKKDILTTSKRKTPIGIPAIKSVATARCSENFKRSKK